MMTDESDVRTWFATAEVPDLRTDLRQTVADGRVKIRRRRVQRIAGAGALTLAVLVAVPGVVALANRDHPAIDGPVGVGRNPNACGYHALEVPNDPGVKAMKNPEVFVSAVDPTGRYAVGTARDVDQSQLLILWEDGRPRMLPPETRNGFAMGVNESGHVLGKAGLNEYGALGPWVYRNGSIERLGIPADAAGSEISGINAEGDVVGYLAYSGGRELETRGVVWPAGDLSTPQRTPDPTNPRFSANWVATDGSVLGTLSPDMRPYVWADGKGTELTAPDDAATIDLMDANGDWVVGVTRPDGSIYRWQLSTGQVTRVTVPGSPFTVNRIRVRTDGSVVAIGSGQDGREVVLRGDRRKELSVPDGSTAYAATVNIDGTVVYGTVRPKAKASGPPTGHGIPPPAYWTC